MFTSAITPVVRNGEHDSGIQNAAHRRRLCAKERYTALIECDLGPVIGSHGQHRAYHRPTQKPHPVDRFKELFLNFLAFLYFKIFIGLIIFGFWLYGLSASRSHEWYPLRCCSGGDCGPIAPSRVEENSTGFVIDGKFTFLHQHTQQSQDGQYHACFPQPDRLECFFAPPKGM